LVWLDYYHLVPYIPSRPERQFRRWPSLRGPICDFPRKLNSAVQSSYHLSAVSQSVSSRSILPSLDKHVYPLKCQTAIICILLPQPPTLNYLSKTHTVTPFRILILSLTPRSSFSTARGMAQQGVGNISAKDQAKLETRLSKMSPEALFLWAAGEAGTEAENLYFEAHHQTVIDIVAMKNKLVLNPLVVKVLRFSIDHHNALVNLAFSQDIAPNLIANRAEDSDMARDWGVRIDDISDCKLSLMQLISTAAAASFDISSKVPAKQQYSSYLRRAITTTSQAWFFNLAYVLMSRLVHYQVCRTFPFIRYGRAPCDEQS
jgi:hypothetical protein